MKSLSRRSGVARRRIGGSLIVVATGFVVAAAFNVQARQAPPASQAAPAAAAEHQALMGKYCASCHSDKMKAGGLAISTLDIANLGRDAAQWEHVVRKVRTGAMPPGGRPRPDKAATDKFVTYLETGLDRAAAAHVNAGRLALQRLNRNEYRNAVRDLLAVEIDAAPR